MVIGFTLNSGVMWGVVLAPFYMLTMSRLVIEKEETYLERKFGKTYTSYTSHVRRWL
jgi:protein-S-isoprenylcysteine O-methyltransferase Ste14